MKRDFVLFSDSVTEGHPDKLCDQISDAIVDHFLQIDSGAHVVAECAVATGVMFIANRCRASQMLDVTEVARQVIEEVGYTGPDFNAKDCTILSNLSEFEEDSPETLAVEALETAEIDDITASHQATLFGFACNHNAAYLPQSLWLAHQLARQLDAVRHESRLGYLLPDGTSQVGVEYRDYRPSRVHSLTLQTSQRKHDGPAANQVVDDMQELVLEPVFKAHEIKRENGLQIFINPDGPLLSGGPALHAGLTGRKNAIDTYGQFSRHSGAALSGKDPSRIDRCGAYYARYAAKNIIAAGLADLCEIQLSYGIGQAMPISLQVETFGTGKLSDSELQKRVTAVFDFRVGAILQALQLHTLPAQNPDGFFHKLACYGHMGRTDLEVPWERLDKVEALRG